MSSSSSSPTSPSSSFLACLNPNRQTFRCRVVDRETALYSLQTATGRSGPLPSHGKFDGRAPTEPCPCNQCCPCAVHAQARQMRAQRGTKRKAPPAPLEETDASAASAAAAAAASSFACPPAAVRCTDLDVVHSKSDLGARFLVDPHRIGSGTFSSVYRATVRRDHPSNAKLVELGLRDVAIKRFLTHSHPQRLQAEQMYLDRFGDLDQHVLPLLDTHHPIGAPPALILPFCAHQDFRSFYRTMSLRSVQTYMRGLLTALRHLHRYAIIHRDVKPENYLYDFEAGVRAEEAAAASSASVPASAPPRLGFLVDFGLAHTVMDLARELHKDHRLDPATMGDLIEAQQAKADQERREAEQQQQQQQVDERQSGEGASMDVDGEPAASPPSDSTTSLLLQRTATNASGASHQPSVPATPRTPASSVGLASPNSINSGAARRCSPRKGKAPPSSSALLLRPGGGVHPAAHAPLDAASKVARRLASSRLADRPIHPRAGTRGYRAPETLAYAQEQTCAVDVWSAGCILLAILSHRYPFFNAPSDEVGLAEVLHALSNERGDVVIELAGQRVTFEQNSAPPFDLEAYCARSSGRQWPAEAYDLMRQMLAIQPEKRITAKAALDHPFMRTDWRREEEEQTAGPTPAVIGRDPPVATAGHKSSTKKPAGGSPAKRAKLA